VPFADGTVPRANGTDADAYPAGPFEESSSTSSPLRENTGGTAGRDGSSNPADYSDGTIGGDL